VTAAVVVAIAAWLLLSWPKFPRQGFVSWSDSKGKLANFKSAFLPALTLGFVEAAVLIRVLRADMITTLQEDYITMARAKGLPPWRILLVDALRPSSFSALTIAGVTFGRLLGGTVIVEAIFQIPGMGSLMISSIYAHDLGVVQVCVLVIASLFLLVNFLVDLLYSFLDPRIRAS
jgi:peptide/nickel transport system permease protein